ncbi:GGDEF domain-containing protein [Gilvimarinus agarilyticus]|uniref:GGDEF domain-containing protein n=1 Tax=Gilvimarinus sp. 2_MG-2023 TaxID=3062666 RepID=UPI001C084AA8|nr:GGDEF domain-containing protein [Gilvimarinus sp. 2_MG-2023]MBU2885109.1 GGDEF domain-containing protein [Gilvimarinus agarilyticus]MDO6570007.1 GGDEF domain-containing protein [Gilvimarinus sp. 2_MG-2023]
MADLSSGIGTEAIASELISEQLANSALLDVRARLAHALQISLEATELLTLFFKHSQQLVQYHGLVYEDVILGKVLVGKRSLHRCHYTMNLPGSNLGEITFFRKSRFSENQQLMLETLLASLAFPLNNAKKYQQALRMALVDPLTEVGNRSALDTALEREHQRLQRNGKAFALVMLDIDHFKQINDKYGHSRGDDVLKQIATTLKEVSRATDMTFRYGGEEFAVLLSDTGAAGGLITAERLRRAVERIDIVMDGAHIRPTISVGVSACMDAGEPLQALLERADRALYDAKRQGRNRSCCEPAQIPLDAATGVKA